MARTNATAVLLVIDSDLTTDQINAFIDDASAWVDLHLAGKCAGLGTTELTIIEKYLAAHLISAREPLIRSKRRGDVWDEYQRDGKKSEYLKAAMAYDACGIIDEAFSESDGKRFQFRVGKGFDTTLDLPESSS